MKEIGDLVTVEKMWNRLTVMGFSKRDGFEWGASGNKSVTVYIRPTDYDKVKNTIFGGVFLPSQIIS